MRPPAREQDLARVLGAGADRAGWLVLCLDEFARREINLTKIESRPMRERLGHYMFFVDLEGSLADEVVSRGARRSAGNVRAGARVRLLPESSSKLPDGRFCSNRRAVIVGRAGTTTSASGTPARPDGRPAGEGTATLRR